MIYHSKIAHNVLGSWLCTVKPLGGFKNENL